ncbi:MAG: SulP family inorganic anion transporter [Flavobacteriales bacterium]|nr:SulP family inorganic anion transporter [Flavobacteriales bacterium]
MPKTTAHRLDQYPQGWWRYFPALDSLRKYDSAAARADLLAGLSVAAVAVPQAVAYALVAGVPPEYGLYTAIVMTAIGAFFASSRQLINGPTNAISIAVLSATAMIPLAAKFNAVLVLALLIGSLQVMIALARIGDLTRYISHSVVVGFTAGASVLLIMDQLKNLLGLRYKGDAHEPFVIRFWHTMTEGGAVDPATLTIGLASMALLLGLRWAKRRLGWRLFPELLVTVISISLLSWLWQQGSVALVGQIPAKLPSFHVPHVDLALARELAPAALAIGTLGLLEAIAMSKSIANAANQRLDLNQTCLSEGLANLGAGLFNGIPGSGSITRSAINVQAGARTQWSGIFSAAAVALIRDALIVLLFADLAEFIPKAGLAGILIVTGFRLIDPKALRYHLRASKFDAGIVLATAFSAVFISIEFCVLIGVFLSFLLAVPRAGRMLLSEFTTTSEQLVTERLPGDTACGRILIFGLEGEMFFSSATALEGHFQTIERRLTPGTRVLVLRLKRARNPDAVCLHLLNDFVRRVEHEGVEVILCGVNDDLFAMMQRTGSDLLKAEVFREQKVRFTSTMMAVKRAYEIIGDDRCEHCPRHHE